MLFKEQGFDKVVEYTESDEEGSSQGGNIEEDILDFKDEYKEVSEEQLHTQIMRVKEEKIGPSLFDPISLLGKGSFGEVYLVR